MYKVSQSNLKICVLCKHTGKSAEGDKGGGKVVTMDSSFRHELNSMGRTEQESASEHGQEMRVNQE